MAPTHYSDSSFLVSLLRDDANHSIAVQFMQNEEPILPFTPLHRIEVRNALRWAETQGQITGIQRRDAFSRIEEDLQTGFLVPTPISWTDMLRRADDLSDRHREKDGQRTLDLLHVAIALELHASVFLSFDKRQGCLAKAAGLRLAP